MTLSDAIDILRQATNDTSTDTDRQRRSNTVLVAKVNIAEKKFVRATKCLKKEDTLTLTESSDEASVPSDFLCADDDDLIGGEGIIILNDEPLDYRTTGWLDKHSSGWRGATDSTPDKWHFKDLETIRFNCPLDSTAAAYTCDMRYVKMPTAHAAGTLTTEILGGITALEDFQHVPLNWVLKELKKEDRLLEESKVYEALWRDGVEDAKAELKKMLSMQGHLRADPRWVAQWPRPPE